MLERKRRGRLVSARREVAEQNRIRNSYERRLTSQLRNLFESIAETAVREYQVGGSPIVRLENVTNRISEVLVPHYRSVILAMADRFRTVKVKQDYEGVVRNYLRDTATDRIIGISTTTQNLIRRALLEADQETNPRQAAKLIEERVGGAFGRRRAITIARTETHAAASYANHEVAKDLGVPMRKQWVATNDGRTRTWHSNVNGQTVDLDEDFIVPYKGVEYRMKHTGDPNGGAHNTINCRCVTIYLEPEDVVVDDQPKQPKPSPQQPSDISAYRHKYDSVRRTEINGDTLLIERADTALASLTSRFSRSQNDERYMTASNKPVSTYRGRELKDYGEARLSGASDKMATALDKIMEELDEIANRTGVPPLRGMKKLRSNSSSTADMGDGVMGWNLAWWKEISDSIGRPALDTTRLKLANERIAAYELELESRVDQLRKLRADYLEGFSDFKNGKISETLFRTYHKNFNDYSAELEKWKKKSRKEIKADYQYAKGTANPSASKWKQGDNPNSRPWSAKYYFEDPVDKIRATAYHEMGHHVHQMWEPMLRGYSGSGRLDRGELTRRWRHKKTAATEYSDSNKHEWFAENFALFWMGRRDLVAPKFLDYMEEVLDVEIPR